MDDNFGTARVAFEGLVGFLGHADAAKLTHAELEERIRSDGFVILNNACCSKTTLRHEAL